MAEEALILLISYAGIDKYKPFPIFYQKQPHSPGTQVIIVSRVEFIPDRFGHNAKHRAAVEFEITCVYGI
jgi:hypothetical protein